MYPHDLPLTGNEGVHTHNTTGNCKHLKIRIHYISVYAYKVYTYSRCPLSAHIYIRAVLTHSNYGEGSGKLHVLTLVLEAARRQVQL